MFSEISRPPRREEAKKEGREIQKQNNYNESADLSMTSNLLSAEATLYSEPGQEREEEHFLAPPPLWLLFPDFPFRTWRL